MTQLRKGLVVACVLIAAACGSSGPDRADTLAALGADHIVPVYEAFATDAAALQAATSSFCDAPSADGLTAAQDAMIAARASWKVTEAMWVGPVMDRRSFALIDWRTSTAEIESLIANTDLAIDAQLLAKSIGSDQRGLGALEYLLFTEPALDALQEDRRCAYASGLAVVIDDEAQGVVQAWTGGVDGGVPFTEAFPIAGNRHLDGLVNDQLILLRKMVSAELGGALGLMPTEPGVDALIEGPAGVGRADFESRLHGVRVVLIGAGDGGLSPNLSEGLVARIGAALDRADAALATVPAGSIRTSFEQDAEPHAALREALAELRGLVATEVVSELGVAVGFSDADGDSGG